MRLRRSFPGRRICVGGYIVETFRCYAKKLDTGILFEMKKPRRLASF